MDMTQALQILQAESQALDDLVTGALKDRGADAVWTLPTPSPGWDVGTQIAHLLWTDRQALLAVNEPQSFEAGAADLGTDTSAMDAENKRIAAVGPDSVLADWRETRARLAAALADVATDELVRKLPWFGPPMRPLSMVTARIMETWAHGLDVYDALGVDKPQTAALAAVARIGVRTMGFSFINHGLEAPDAEVRVELTLPIGVLPGTEVVEFGPEDAQNRVWGSADAFARVVTQRRNAADVGLQATGPVATAWLPIAQAFAGPPTEAPEAGTRPDVAPEAGTRPGTARPANHADSAGAAEPINPGTTSPAQVSATAPADRGTRPVRIGNCSGFYGDRLSAMREMLEGGPLDVLTGDYLAELTMLILARQKAKDPATGFAKTFLKQVTDSLEPIADSQVRIVANAGGMNPGALADALRQAIAASDNPAITPEALPVAYIDGDDVTDRAEELGLGTPLAANAYLGGFGIKTALDAGARIVVTGRVTDASVIVGAAAWWHDWARTDYDALAGAMAAGHVIECGTQATGGNFAFFDEIADMARPGFPLAELHSDGTSIITKHPDTGGAVTCETVLSQLVYEIQGARYPGPDATLRLDSLCLHQEGPDRVEITGVRGEAPPPEYKVSVNQVGGFRQEIEFLLTGLNIEAKARMTREQFAAAHRLAGLPAPAEEEWLLVRTDVPDAPTEEQAVARLRLVARDPDPKVVGRAYSNLAVEIALAGYPGCHVVSPPGNGAVYGRYSAGFVPVGQVPHRVHLPDGTEVDVEAAPETLPLAPTEFDGVSTPEPAVSSASEAAAERTVEGTAAEGAAPETPAGADAKAGASTLAPLGTVAGARSGDKGGNANIGVWARSDAGWDWLRGYLTADRVRALLPEAAALKIDRVELAGVRAVNFVIHDFLGEGVAAGARFDPQAKGLAEYLRSRHVDVPTALVQETRAAPGYHEPAEPATASPADENSKGHA